VVSQAIQFLSRLVPVAVVTGLPQLSPPLVERLVTTAAPCTPPASDRASEETIHTLSWGS
jgi:hypothetical protein